MITLNVYNGILTCIVAVRLPPPLLPTAAVTLTTCRNTPFLNFSYVYTEPVMAN
jgi:hypothetical protein